MIRHSPCPPAHTTHHRTKGFCADAHGLTRKSCWWWCCTPPLTPPTHLPTHSRPATTQGFFADTHRLTVTPILGLILEHRNIERTANAVADMEMLLVGDVVRNQYQLTHPSTNIHPATIQSFFADTHRLTVKAILRLMLEHCKNKRTANNTVTQCS